MSEYTPRNPFHRHCASSRLNEPRESVRRDALGCRDQPAMSTSIQGCRDDAVYRTEYYNQDNKIIQTMGRSSHTRQTIISSLQSMGGQKHGHKIVALEGSPHHPDHFHRQTRRSSACFALPVAVNFGLEKGVYV